MEKRSVKALGVSPAGRMTALVVLCVFFLLGAVAGCLLADRVDGGGADALAVYLEQYLTQAREGGLERPQVFSLAWELLRWPLLTVLLGLTALGVLGLPVLFAVRGFLLSFAVASFFRVFGGMGLILAFLVFGLTGLVTIPVLFVLGVQGFLTAGRLAGDGAWRAVPGRGEFVRFGLCAAALSGCFFAEYLAVPVLLAETARLLL